METIIVAAIMSIINITVHSAGIHFLRLVIKDGRLTVRLLYVLNISCAEISACVLQIPSSVLHFCRHCDEIKVHVDKIAASWLFSVIVLTMMSAQLDLVLGVCFHLCYPKIWHMRKAKILVISIWVFSLLWYIVDTCIYVVTRIRYGSLFFALPVSVLHIVFTVTSHVYILYKLNKSRMMSHDRRQTNSTLWAVFRRSRFFITVLFTCSYTVCHAIPVVCFISWNIREQYQGNFSESYITISHNVMFLFNGFLYIFCEPNVKRVIRLISNQWRQDGIQMAESRFRSVREHPEGEHILVIEDISAPGVTK